MLWIFKSLKLRETFDWMCNTKPTYYSVDRDHKGIGRVHFG